MLFLFLFVFLGALLPDLQCIHWTENWIVLLNTSFYWLIVNITKLYRKRLLCCTRWNALILEFYATERCESHLNACTFSIARQICETAVSQAGFAFRVYVSRFRDCMCVNFQNALNNAEMNIFERCRKVDAIPLLLYSKHSERKEEKRVPQLSGISCVETGVDAYSNVTCIYNKIEFSLFQQPSGIRSPWVWLDLSCSSYTKRSREGLTHPRSAEQKRQSEANVHIFSHSLRWLMVLCCNECWRWAVYS